MLKKLFLIIPIALLAACTQIQSKPFAINSVNALPNVEIEFETTVVEVNETERHHRWKFWRNHNRIETHNLSDNSGEIWIKSNNDAIEYQRVFHDQKQIIDYRDSDLVALGSTPNWFAVATLVNPAIIQTLLSDNQENEFEQLAVHYKNDDIEMTWLTQSQIPAMIKRYEHGHLLLTKIINIKTNAPLETSQYQHTDFADIGDKENDPFIKSVLSKLKGGHNHEH